MVTASAGSGLVGDVEMGCSAEVLLYHSCSITYALQKLVHFLRLLLSRWYVRVPSAPGGGREAGLPAEDRVEGRWGRKAAGPCDFFRLNGFVMKHRAGLPDAQSKEVVHWS